ncbi:hypothetical protein [Hyphococcus lacteus]|uniref:Uncharacterized protein n=1 Tax=Hyphococcus lacteus TaxID=3143536 RepID=A0ABV3Z3F7_9PROT
MNEKEARDFIEHQVFRSLRGYGFVFLGIAALLGFVFGKFAYVIGESEAAKSSQETFDRLNSEFSSIREEYGRFLEIRNRVEGDLVATQSRLDAADAEGQKILRDLQTIREIDIRQLVGEEELLSLRVALVGELGELNRQQDQQLSNLRLQYEKLQNAVPIDTWPIALYCDYEARNGKIRLTLYRAISPIESDPSLFYQQITKVSEQNELITLQVDPTNSTIMQVSSSEGKLGANCRSGVKLGQLRMDKISSTK